MTLYIFVYRSIVIRVLLDSIHLYIAAWKLMDIIKHLIRVCCKMYVTFLIGHNLFMKFNMTFLCSRSEAHCLCIYAMASYSIAIGCSRETNLATPHPLAEPQ